MRKVEFSEVSDKISDLFTHYLDVIQKMTMEAEDRKWDDAIMLPTSESADKASWAWFEEQKLIILTECGWTLEDYEAAEKVETEAWYAALDSTPLPVEPKIRVIHDPDDEELSILVSDSEVEDGWDFLPEPVDLNEIEAGPTPPDNLSTVFKRQEG